MRHQPALDPQRRMWTVGDYSQVAQRLLPVSEAVVDAVEAVGGALRDRTVLDAGVGDGNTAVVAAGRGARVVGVDLTSAQLERARERCRREGVEVDLAEGDVQELAFGDGSFDVVVSVFAAIFAPDAERAAGELVRVCAPGGVVAMTAWAAGGWTDAWRARAAEILPPPPGAPPGPDAWGEPAVVRARFAAVGLEASVEQRPHWWEFGSVDEGVAFLFANAGPFIAFREGAAAVGREDEARAGVADALAAANDATDGTLRAPSPYLLVVGRRA